MNASKGLMVENCGEWHHPGTSRKGWARVGTHGEGDQESWPWNSRSEEFLKKKEEKMWKKTRESQVLILTLRYHVL